MAAATIDRETLLADLQRLVKDLKADLLERSGEVPEVDAGLRAAHRAIAERRAHGAGVRGVARRLPRTGGGGLGAGLRLRAVHGGQRPDRRDLPGRHGRPPPPGRGRARGLLPRPPARQRPRLPARRLPQGRLDPGGPRPVRRGQDADLGRRPLGRRRRRGCWRSGGRSTPRSAACGGRSRVEGGDTRFLGDLYQDLSEAARKKYALLQTPEFVEEFILDHTLDAGDRRVRPGGGPADRPDLRLGPLPARGVPAAVRPAGPSASRGPSRPCWPSGRSTRCTAWT